MLLTASKLFILLGSMILKLCAHLIVVSRTAKQGRAERKRKLQKLEFSKRNVYFKDFDDKMFSRHVFDVLRKARD